MVLTIYDCWESRNAESVLLLLLVLGIFVFSTFLNWTINARALILVAPAVGILAIRASEHQKVTYTRALIIPIAFSVLLSLVVVYADYAYADTGRKAATRLQPIFAGAEKEVLFEGHWGYQYYMEKKGYSHIDLGMPEDENPKDEVSQGLDLSVFGIQAQDMITGWKPHQLLDLSPKRMKDYQEYPIEGFRWLSLMNKNDGTGFYEASFGHLPYRFGRVEPEIFYVYTIKFTESLER